MPREHIGSVTQWGIGSDLDWAYETAISFLHASLGDPPPGCELCVLDVDHDLGSYPVLAVVWSDGVSEPWDYIREAEAALSEFDNAIDWSRVRPSEVRDSGPSANSDFSDPESYLSHLADTFCAALHDCDEDQRYLRMEDLRESADELGIGWIAPSSISWQDEVHAILSPSNSDAMGWARSHVRAGTACQANSSNPGSVIARLYAA